MMTVLPRDATGVAMMTFPGDWLNVTRVAIGASSAQSAAITARLVQVVPSVNCWIRVGSNPTAVVDGDGCWYLPAGGPQEITLASGHKIAVIQTDTAGSLCILPSSAE